MMYQFPMGKVKSWIGFDGKVYGVVSIPYGKG